MVFANKLEAAMYRWDSTLQSAKSVASPYSNGFPSAPYSRASAGLIHSAQSTKQSFGIDALNPEDLFSRYSVSEVKAIQQRLRNDADIKQEELRLMVGERYRDLLQASSSIISMAGSSQRVFDAIEECRGVIIAQEEPPLPSRATAFGTVNDRQLHTLQLLSAHVKVLLDAPEHLWRLIERKNYLSAAWLFLFTRVVHRALAQQDDEQDEDSWSKAGIDIVTEFPLVQRQWEEVSSFRSQIIHKAALSLREMGLAAHAVCATLVTLHLLDSRPLSEAFGALLTQRTKALASLISWKIDHNLPHSANGRSSVYGSNVDSSSSRRYLPKEILQANQKALTAIIDTVSISRQIFQISPAQQMSLISTVLHSIQEGQEASTPDLPSDLVPSTHSLLTNSSSSAHFLLLPPSLQAYKPYIDLTSSSLLYSQTTFRQVLQDWLLKSSRSWQDASNNWLNNLVNVAEIWGMRTSIHKLISDSGLELSEKSQLESTLDRLCHGRISSVWATTLSRAQDAFKSDLSSFLSNLKGHTTPRTPFQAGSPPVVSQTSKVYDSTPFQKYQSSLKQQLLGRTAQLEAVLSTLEQCARSIQKDLSTVLSDDSAEGMAFGRTITEAYQPLAETTSDAVVTILEQECEIALKDTDVSRLVGVANISDELRSSSIFVTHIGCRKSALHSLGSRLDSIFDRVVERWREQVISRIFDAPTSWRSACSHASREASGPSPLCFQSLLALSDALRELGVGQYSPRHDPVVQESLRALINNYLANEFDEPIEQALYDIAFFKAISSRYGASWQDTTKALSDRLESQRSERSDMEDIQRNGSEFLFRTQTLLSLLLPCAAQVRTSLPFSKEAGNQAHFLLFGSPLSSGQEYQPALELAKPSSRFGLLLVSNVENQN